MALSFLARGKGEIKIQVTNQAYLPGDEVIVGVHLTTKKDLGPGRLFGSLIADEKVEQVRLDHDGDRQHHSDTREIYRWDVDLAIDASFAAGTDETFTFVVHVPHAPTNGGGQQAPGWVGALAKMSSFMGPRTTVTWRVECRYDIPRLDLSDRETIHINF